MPQMSDLLQLLAAVKTGSDALGSALGLADKLRDALGKRRDGIDDDTALAGLALDLTKKLVDARLAQAEILHRLHTGENEMKELDRFEKQAARYVLAQTDGGAIVYALKPECAEGEPMHYLCPACFDHRKRPILQPMGQFLRCSHCGTDYAARKGASTVAVTLGRRRF